MANRLKSNKVRVAKIREYYVVERADTLSLYNDILSGTFIIPDGVLVRLNRKDNPDSPNNIMSLGDGVSGWGNLLTVGVPKIIL